MKQYTKTIDSGVDWIGDIPDHWEIRRLKFNDYSIVPGQSPLSSSYSEDDGIFFLQGCREFNQIFPNPKIKTTDPTKIVDKDTVLISVRAPVGEVNITNVPVCIGRGLMGIVCKNEKTDSKFLYYYLKSALKKILSLSRNTTYDSIVKDDLENLLTIKFPYREQKQISKFLDEEILKLDKHICNLKITLELLKEQRHVLIHQTITKGLELSVPMNDSKIEWIGETPVKWNVKKVKFVTKIIYGNALPEEQRIQGEIPVYGSNGIVGYHNSAITSSETIIIGRKGSVGELNYSEVPCFPIDTTYYIDKESTQCNLRWVMYCMSCLNLTKLNKDSAVPGISREEIYHIKIPYNNIQSEIAKFLDIQTTKIDFIVSTIQDQIQKLQDYSQILISNAVTGKIDVR